MKGKVMFKIVSRTLTMMLVIAFILGSSVVVKSQGSGMTEVGTPRNQTLIMDQLDGRVNNPKQMNPLSAKHTF